MALLGVLLAASGLALAQATGSSDWDGLASLLIGCLLVAVAVGLGRQNQQYLIGKAVDSEVARGIRTVIESTDGIDGVQELLTMRLGYDEVLVAARVDLAEGGSGAEFERMADRIDSGIQERYPEVRHVFLEPDSAGASARREWISVTEQRSAALLAPHLLAPVVVAHPLRDADHGGVVRRHLVLVANSCAHLTDGTRRRVHSPSWATSSRVTSLTAVRGSTKPSTPRRLVTNSCRCCSSTCRRHGRVVEPVRVASRAGPAHLGARPAAEPVDQTHGHQCARSAHRSGVDTLGR